MRLRLRFLIPLIVVSVCLACGSRLQSWLQWAARLGGGEVREPVVLSHTYLLSETEWLDFYLPASSHHVSLLVNANFPKSLINTPDEPDSWRPGAVFALEYKFLGAHDELLHADTFHFRVQLPTAKEVTRPQAFYSSEDLLPGIGQSMRRRLASIRPRPSRLRVRLGTGDQRIQDVSVRVYCQNEVPDYKLAHAWRRTNRRRRENLGRASVYGSELLTEYERRNLLKWKWVPVAPSGVEGRDYVRRILYSFVDRQTVPDVAETPAGLLVGGESCGVIPLPDGPGQVRLELTGFNRKHNSASANIYVRWFERGGAQRNYWRIPVASNPHLLETELDGGLLQIESADQFAVRAFWQNGSASGDAEFEEITPQPNSVRAYVVSRQNTVEYAIEHVREETTPLKLAFRQLLPLESHSTSLDETFQPVSIHWCFIDGAGQVVRDGHFMLQGTSSRYDRVSGASTRTRVTDVATRFFAVPPNVRAVRFSSPDTGVIVNAFSRPPDVSGVTFVPEDYSEYLRRQGWHRSWFLLRPTDHLHRVNMLQAVTILTQSRPREVDEQQLAGQYQWESFQPSGRWKGRHLLLPREARFPLRWETLGSAFCELQTGVELDLTLLGEPGHRSVAPHLVCQAAGTLPVRARVYVNDVLHQELRLRSPLAELRLNALPTRREHATRLRIETEGDIRIFMNHIEPTTATVFYKRMVNRLEGTTLEFDYQKRSADEELLSMTLFHSGSQKRARLRVKIAGDVGRTQGPSLDWSLLDRIYELQSTTSTAVPLFAAHGESVFEQHQCFLRLGSDLPPGKYSIRVTREDDRTGYLLLSKTTPGLSERRSLATETEPYSATGTDANRWRQEDGAF